MSIESIQENFTSLRFRSRSDNKMKRDEMEHELGHETKKQPSKSKLFHKVSFADREDAKKEGMRWDSAAKKWYHTNSVASSNSKFQKEDVDLDDEQIDEITGIAVRYKEKAEAQVKELKPWTKKGEYRDLAKNLIKRREAGLAKVKKRLPEEADIEEEKIEELNKSTLNNYINKSAGDYGYQMRSGKFDKAGKRLDGSIKAQKKIITKSAEKINEDNNDMNTINKESAMDQYIKAINDDTHFTDTSRISDNVDVATITSSPSPLITEEADNILSFKTFLNRLKN